MSRSPRPKPLAKPGPEGPGTGFEPVNTGNDSLPAEPCGCPCHLAPNHDFISKAVWHQFTDHTPGFNEQMARARKDFEEGRGVPLKDIHREFAATSARLEKVREQIVDPTQ